MTSCLMNTFYLKIYNTKNKKSEHQNILHMRVMHILVKKNYINLPYGNEIFSMQLMQRFAQTCVNGDLS